MNGEPIVVVIDHAARRDQVRDAVLDNGSGERDGATAPEAIEAVLAGAPDDLADVIVVCELIDHPADKFAIIKFSSGSAGGITFGSDESAGRLLEHFADAGFAQAG